MATMQLALEQHDGQFYPYLRVVAVNAEEGASSASDRLASRQPPSAYEKSYDSTTSALDDAESLLSDTRIAVVGHEEREFPSLVQQLSDTSEQLQQLENRLRAVPDDWRKP
ncbi:hypothetical protein [Nocardioides sp. Kera G14]|uniref:hypothetical protein n=1 Tax=Nocardioides sp. Kera G14 TaxID=2884264 RepID=UPI001D10FBEC|nr:hypothetical protein [Nocardioides sp. Kera G14]UDY25184.1 hypothetical protein LH076_07815 [Nocardioides sp. Kera G14]